jgi:hypothetical protein
LHAYILYKNAGCTEGLSVKDHTAAFTLSLDCEGLWGMADNPVAVSNGLINGASLFEAYATILSTLDQNCLKATAAFVTCFAVTLDGLLDQRNLLNAVAELNPDWFKHILVAIETGKMEGWSGNRLYLRMRNAGHEIAWHGTTHQPLSNAASKESVELELRLTTQLFRQLGQRPGTIIFPRNQVGHIEVLRRYGFNSYRQGHSVSTIGKAIKLLAELNVMDRGCRKLPNMHNGMLVSPGGFFLNWPSGIRALVPISVTVQRWKSMLRHAVETGGYLHMWFHPHNFITAPEMVESFKMIMDCVGELVQSGDLVSLTIEETKGYYT